MLFEEATGIRLAIYTDSDASAYADGKFIGLGETTCMKNAGVTTEGKNLDKHGYIIKTVDDAIYICGGDENGTSFGVYGFLELEFGFDCFSNTCYYIDQGVTDKKLRAYDVTDIPDMKIRNNGDGYILKNKQTHRWMRYVERETGNTFCGESSAHTAMSYYLKYDTYSELYPEWYASKKQLCYTAKGNAEKLDRMQEEVFNLLKAEAIADTEGYLFVFRKRIQASALGANATRARRANRNTEATRRWWWLFAITWRSICRLGWKGRRKTVRARLQASLSCV